MIGPGALVIVHLVNPTEKLWGVLGELSLHGATLRAISVESFDDWMAQAVRGSDQTLGLATLFVPLFRVEKMYLDESVGEVESYHQRFRRRVGLSVHEYIGLGDDTGDGSMPS
ncbi:MAG: hypothetical protein KDD11_02125 [Acidobacteria bacterium]|nr:hypothetical protein [Acidobacteriota bacterium]